MKLNINGKEIEVSSEDLSKAIEEKKETFEVKAEDLVIRSTTEDATFKENIQKESNGVGIEIGRKNILKGLGIDTEGGLHKDDTKSLDALNTFITGKVASELQSAKIEPDKKVQELTKDIDTLRTTISRLSNDKESARMEFNTFKNTQVISTSLSNAIPENTILPKSDMLTLLGSKIKADINENGVVFAIGEDGNPVKNKVTLELTPIKEVVTTFFNDNSQYIKGPKGGAGGEDSKGGESKQSIEDFIKEMSDQNIHPNSVEFNAEAGKRREASLIDF